MNDNETVEQVFYSVEAECYNKQGRSFFGVNDVREIDRRFLAAHKREVAELTANLDALEKAMERVCSRDEVNEIVAIKKEIQNEGK